MSAAVSIPPRGGTRRERLWALLSPEERAIWGDRPALQNLLLLMAMLRLQGEAAELYVLAHWSEETRGRAYWWAYARESGADERPPFSSIFGEKAS